jgi:hypothetical protein
MVGVLKYEKILWGWDYFWKNQHLVVKKIPANSTHH